MLRLFCVDEGCVLRRLDNYRVDGELVTPTELLPSCSGACPVCTDQFAKHFRTIWKDAAPAWLESVHDQFLLKATVSDLFDLLWQNQLWTEAIFDYAVESINKYNVKAFLLQLLASNILAAEKRGDAKNGSNLRWILYDEERNEGARLIMCYKLDNYWTRVSTHQLDNKRQHNYDLADI